MSVVHLMSRCISREDSSVTGLGEAHFSFLRLLEISLRLDSRGDARDVREKEGKLCWLGLD